MDARGTGTSGPRLAIVWAIVVVYGAFLALVAFWPTPVDRPVEDLLKRVISELHERGVPEFVDYGFIEIGANVLLFVPVGLALGLALPPRAWLVMLVGGAVVSGLIELIQREALSDRYASWSDVVANTAGAAVGVGIALAVRAVVASRDSRVVARHEAARSSAE